MVKEISARPSASVWAEYFSAPAAPSIWAVTLAPGWGAPAAVDTESSRRACFPESQVRALRKSSFKAVEMAAEGLGACVGGDGVSGGWVTEVEVRPGRGALRGPTGAGGCGGTR